MEMRGGIGGLLGGLGPREGEGGERWVTDGRGRLGIAEMLLLSLRAW